jgi:hypothetical protein
MDVTKPKKPAPDKPVQEAEEELEGRPSHQALEHPTKAPDPPAPGQDPMPSSRSVDYP